jgi:hypothetical protein
VNSKIAGKPADMPSNRRKERYREFGIAAIDQYPERQFVRGQPVKTPATRPIPIVIIASSLQS